MDSIGIGTYNYSAWAITIAGAIDGGARKAGAPIGGCIAAFGSDLQRVSCVFLQSTQGKWRWATILNNGFFIWGRRFPKPKLVLCSSWHCIPFGYECSGGLWWYQPNGSWSITLGGYRQGREQQNGHYYPGLQGKIKIQSEGRLKIKK